ncbi:MAG: DNA polymerase IV [Trueperaceae bacterium]|nr:MAG: DNA polymerase IV [Trueperaceae bacterium]
MASVRKVVHVDMDAFYAAVEQRDEPSLRGRPVAVGGGSERGVVMTASYEARRFGVRSAMPTVVARRACPDLIVVPPRFAAYHEASAAVHEVFRSFTDLVEPLALDEAFLDVTEPKRGPPSGTLLARAIKAEIRASTGLTASAGVANGKFVAKVASGMHKPDGLTVVTPEEVPAFVAALPIEAFFGVGPRTAERLHALGVHTGADLLRVDEAALAGAVGKLATFLRLVARGVDDRPVVPDRRRKSIGAERTFDRDLSARDDLESELAAVCEAVGRRLVRARLAARTVTVKVKYRDFRVITRSTTPATPVASTADLRPWADALLFATPRPVGALRLVGVSLSGLFPADRRVVQPPLPFSID